MSDKKKWKVGDTLWFVPSARWDGEPRLLRVLKVGRKWLDCANASEANPAPHMVKRFYAETLYGDGSRRSSPGRCWPTREDYERETARAERWRRIFARLSYGSHRYVSDEVMDAIERAMEVKP